MITDRERSWPCRILLVAAAVAVVWAWVVSFTGGTILHLGPIRFTSRQPRNPWLIALAASASAWILAPRGRRYRTVIAEWAWLATTLERVMPRLSASHIRWLVTACVGVLVVAVIAVGILRGAFVAGGADAYGYVSQARLWRAGVTRAPLPQVGALPDGIGSDVLVPLGYRLGLDQVSLVPVYAPGFPMLMALFEYVAGADTMFYLMPLLGGIAVWATYLLGTAVAGRIAGIIAALLLATSPAFVLQLTHAPMSDIAAMAAWTIALVLMPRASRTSALGTGAAVAVAVLIRPNLVPVAIVPVAFLVTDIASTRISRFVAVQRLLLFGIASVPACLTIAYLNDAWYGSPLASGYGSLAGILYRWDYFWPNIAQTSRRLIESETPIIMAALVSPVLLWRRVEARGATGLRWTISAYVAFAIGVYGCYAFFLPLDVWWALRLLFPALPILFLLLSVALLSVSDRLPPHARWLTVVVLVGSITAHGIAFGRISGALDSSEEWRYVTVGRYIARNLPERAVLFAMLHSGSARFYSGRATIRYDLLAPHQLEPAVTHFRREGYPPFLLLDDNEKEQFVRQFSGVTPLAVLDWPPMATIDGVVIYDLAQAPTMQARQTSPLPRSGGSSLRVLASGDP